MFLIISFSRPYLRKLYQAALTSPNSRKTVPVQVVDGGIGASHRQSIKVGPYLSLGSMRNQESVVSLCLSLFDERTSLKVKHTLGRRVPVKASKLLYFGAAVILGFAASMGYAQGNGNDHEKGHYKDKHSNRDHDRDARVYTYSYSKHDRDELHNWYDLHRGNLPPGLAKKDRLPPGWEKKVVVHQVMPVEYREYVRPAPVEIVRVLPPPPPDCEHVIVGGHIVLMNRKTSVILDIFNAGF
jgi:hypothetical protein